MEKATIGFIGGSGLYEIEGSKIIDELQIETPWGSPSDKISIVEIDGLKAAFLPRHGRGHKYLPHEVNAMANIAALKKIGVEEIVAFSAVGSLKAEIKPLDFIIPDQIIDRTTKRESSYFGNGVGGHVAFADPFCSRLQKQIKKCADNISLKYHEKETLICMEGPAFSTRAESNLYRSWGAGIINMSTIPESKLAREAEICYAVVCMSTDYDCWKEDEEHVTIELVIQNLTINSTNAKKLIKEILHSIKNDGTCKCDESSKYAVITSPDKRNKEQVEKLKFILPEYF